MPGKRDKYIYELYNNKNDEICMKGLARTISEKLGINQNRLYMCFKNGGALFGRYYIERTDIDEVGIVGRYSYEIYNSNNDKLFASGSLPELSKKMGVDEEKIYLAYLRAGTLLEKYYVDRTDVLASIYDNKEFMQINDDFLKELIAKNEEKVKHEK